MMEPGNLEKTVELFKLTRASLQSFANSFLKNNEDAQDVVQEVFKECLEKKNILINRPYLFKAVRNRSLNKIRSHNRFSNALEKFNDYLSVLTQSRVQNNSIVDLLAYLPEKQKEVLVLRVKAELKISEIAEILSIPEGTVKSRISNGIKNLKKQIKR